MVPYLGLLARLAPELIQLIFLIVFSFYLTPTGCLLSYKESYICVLTVRVANAENVPCLSPALSHHIPWQSEKALHPVWLSGICFHKHERDGATPGSVTRAKAGEHLQPSRYLPCLEELTLPQAGPATEPCAAHLCISD